MRELIDIACTVLHETDKAYLIDDGARKVWLPKSQCEKNEDGTVTLPMWLAKEKELI
jgi:hypothetical protein